MQTQIVKMINDFEHGQLSRRQLIAHLTGMSSCCQRSKSTSNHASLDRSFGCKLSDTFAGVYRPDR